MSEFVDSAIEIELFAEMAGITVRQVRNLLHSGLPVDANGMPMLIAGMAWYCAKLRAETPGEKERTLKTRAEREMAEMNLAKARGQLLDADDVVSGWEAALGRFRSRMLGMPATVSQECVIRARDGEQEIRKYLKGEVDKALAELSRVRFDGEDDDEDDAIAA